MLKRWRRKLANPFVGACLLFLSGTLCAETDSLSMGSQANHPGLRDLAVPTVATKQLAQKAMLLRLREFSIAAPTLELTPPSLDEIAAILRQNGEGTAIHALQIGATRDLSESESALASKLLADFAPVDQAGMTAKVKVLSAGAKAVRLRIDFSDELLDDVIFRFRGLDSEEIEVVTGRQIKVIARGERFFWTPITFGEAQLIEISLPPDIAGGSSAFSIGGVSHLLAKPTDPAVQSAVMSSLSCEVDVACYTGAEERATSKAVARMVYTDTLGSYLCTGTLLNDADTRTYVPYFYTASHCISSQSVASSLVTYWSYEATSCGSGVLGNYTTLSSGAFLYSTDAVTDATLLVLNQDAPTGAVFSGWNAASVLTTAPATTIGIHHPAGDLKKLSIANPSLSFAPFNGVGSFIQTTWTSGTTEGGSSGSGLFTRTASDSSYQLRGGLKGGNASCVNGVGVSLYSRLDLAYPAIQPYINGPITPLPTAALLTPSSLSVSVGAPLTLTARLIILAGYPYATGTVTFYDGTTPIGTATVQPEFVTYPYTVAASITISNLIAGNHNLTVSYAGDSLFSPTTSAAVTVAVGATSLIVNPGFESGAVGWSQSSQGGYTIISSEPSFAHAGSYDAWLGGYVSGVDIVSQNVTIPANAQSPTLRYWYRIATNETTTFTAYDFLFVNLYIPGTSTLLATLATHTNLNAASVWQQSPPIDLSAYKGQTVQLAFGAVNDSSLPTNFRIDDVSVTAVLPVVPGISGTSPSSGVVGTTVTLTGTNFAPSATVTVGGVSAAVTGAVSTTSMQIVVPNVAPGVQSIVVTVNGIPSAPFGFNVVLPSFFVTPTAGANGSISPNTITSITQGATTSFTVLPNAGYAASVSGTCGGQLVGTTFTTSPITADCSVIANFTYVITVPSPPTITAAVAGNAQATVSFDAPTSSGGLAITRYTAICGGVSSVGMISPIVVAPLANDTTYTCYVTAQNSFGTSAPSAGLNVTPSAAAPLALNAAQSRKVHQGGYVCDIPINVNAVLSGSVSVEPRAIGDGHLLVLQFNNAVLSVGNVSALNAAGGINVVSTAISGNEVSVMLGAVPNNQRVQVNLTSVAGASNVINATVSLGYLFGDLNGSRSVTASDVVTAKSRSIQSLSPANCAADVNLSGSISSVDVTAVKTRAGSLLNP